MPAGNGTGPRGLGPITGRGTGYCAGYSAPGYANPVTGGGFYGRGRGRGGGGGRGWRNQYYATGQPNWARGGYRPYQETYGYDHGYPAPELTREAEAKILKEQAEFMQKEISAIQDRIKELGNIASVQKDKS
ncbi:MAG: DUF5320 domain-containing protein [Spirochaetota bacterium]